MTPLTTFRMNMLTLFLEHFSLFYPEEIALLEVCVCLFQLVGFFFLKFSFVLFCSIGFYYVIQAGLALGT